MRKQFDSAKANFSKFDTNHDNVIDSTEFGLMLDQVLKDSDVAGWSTVVED